MSTHLLFLISLCLFSLSYLLSCNSFPFSRQEFSHQLYSPLLISSHSCFLSNFIPYFLMLTLFLFTHCLLSLTLLFPSLSSCFLSSLFLCTHLISSPLDYFPLLFSHSPCLQYPLTMSSFIDYFLPQFLFNLLFHLFPLFLLPLLLFD